MKTKSITDTLGIVLQIARILIFIVLGALAIGGIALVVSLPFVDHLNSVEGVTVDMDWDDHDVFDLIELIGTAVGFFIALKVVNRLIIILKTIGQGTPFERENGDRLAKIAQYLVIGQIVQIILMIAVLVIPHMMGIDHDGGDWSISLSMLLAAAIAAVLAEVFRDGARLREEQEFTV